MKQGPLTEKELEWLDSILETYGHQDSVINVSELDGFLTALLSSPRAIEPEQWMVNIWGGVKQIPAWRTTHERDHFMDLTFQHMADIEERLIDYPEQFEPLLGIQEVEGQALTVMGDWCYGYMRGVALADWPEVPDQLKPALELIALHGLQEYSEHQQKASFSPEQFEKDIAALPADVLDLHRYWMFHFEQNTPQSLLLTEKISRNDPCPCGSGKKFKQCCLH